MVLEGSKDSNWSQISALLFMAPAATLTGILYVKRKASSERSR
jgi:hypothetical protein